MAGDGLLADHELICDLSVGTPFRHEGQNLQLKVRGMQDATWTTNAEVKGAPSLYEFTAGGALTFNY